MTIHADPWATPDHDPSSIAEQVRPSAVLSTRSGFSLRPSRQPRRRRRARRPAPAAPVRPVGPRLRGHGPAGRRGHPTSAGAEHYHRRRNVHRQHLTPHHTPGPHINIRRSRSSATSTHHIDHPHERKTRTHTHTIATLAELRTALAAGTEPSPCLARHPRRPGRQPRPVPGPHRRRPRSHRSPALRPHRRAPAHGQPPPSRPTPSPPSAFLAGDFSAARKLVAAEAHAAELGVEVPVLIDILKLDYRLAATTPADG